MIAMWRERFCWMVLGAGLLMAGCGQPASKRPAGVVIIDGSSTVYPITKKAQEGFQEKRPEVTVVVDTSGTTGGFERYLSGNVDILNASRPARPEEEGRAKASGREWSRFTVGHDGITVVVNEANDFVDELSVEQLRRLYEPGSEVKTWHDLDPEWPERAIRLFSPDRESGTFDFFTEVVVGKVDEQRKGVSQSADDNVLVAGVLGERDGIGYFGFSYFEDNAAHLRAVPIRDDEAAGAVLPSLETIMEGKYAPLSRPLYLYVRNDSLKRGELAEFLEYYLQNAVTFARLSNYVAPTAEDLSRNAATLKAAIGGR